MKTYFFDASLPHPLASMIQAFARDVRTTHLHDHFCANTPDAEWIRAVASWDPPPVVLTADGRLLRNPAESAVLRESGLTYVVFDEAWARLQWKENAWKYVKVWPQIHRESQVSVPTVFRVTVGMRVEKHAPTAAAGNRRARR